MRPGATIPPRRIRVIVNPSSRSGRGWQALRRVAGEAGDGLHVEWVESRSAEHLGRLVRAAQEEDLDAVGLAGGDGTVTLALNALGGLNRVPLALLPTGSGNDFASDLGIPRDLAGALAV